VDFKKIRLHGFKSFVDQTELLIEPGITGVVGPNGCGKSNVIESLRWVMGETSAKRMRGGEMDDVIFGGSSNRSQRNSAEVSVVLDNADRTAPAAFNDGDEIEITRRIDRGQGSTYRINGKEVRARDVQLLFADLASGANSTAIDLVIPIAANFELLYQLNPGRGRTPAVEAIFRKHPPPCARNTGTAAWAE